MTTPARQLRAYWPYRPPPIEVAYEIVEHRDPAPEFSATLLSVMRGALMGAWLVGCPIALLQILLVHQLGL